MLLTQNKIILQHSKLLKIIFLMISGIFFTTANANLPQISYKIDKPESDISYFLDIDSLQASYDSKGSITHYVEKENPNTIWIVFPIKSSIRDYSKTVASVVAAEFHKRIDEHSLVPLTKFLIGKNINDSGYQLLGSAYKKYSFTTPILKVRKERRFNCHANSDIYRDNKVEHIVSMWRYLGLPVAPDPADLEISEDNKFVRYDYYNAFQYNNSEIHKKCFCISYFPISDYDCNVEYVKSFEQELQSKYKEILKKVTSEIEIDSKKYLAKEELYEVNQALNNIKNFRYCIVN